MLSAYRLWNGMKATDFWQSCATVWELSLIHILEYRLDKTNIIHVPIGKASFTEEQLADNFQTLMGAINKAKPAAVKGQYLRSVTVASTMGPGVKINPLKLA